MNSEIIHQLVDSINQQKLTALLNLFNANSSWIDAGNEFTGSEQLAQYWNNLFQSYPKLFIQIDNQIHHAGTVAVFASLAPDESTIAIPEKCHSFAWKLQLLNKKIQRCEVFWHTPFSSVSLSEPATTKQTISGLGGVFLKSKDPKTLCAWYDLHLGTKFGNNSYHSFKWRERKQPGRIGRTEFSIFKDNSNYFDPSTKPFMLNLRVHKLDAFLDQLQAAGVQVLEKRDYTDYGNFGWIIDPEGNKIEIWEPVDQVLEDFDAANN